MFHLSHRQQAEMEIKHVTASGESGAVKSVANTKVPTNLHFKQCRASTTTIIHPQPQPSPIHPKAAYHHGCF